MNLSDILKSLKTNEQHQQQQRKQQHLPQRILRKNGRTFTHNDSDISASQILISTTGSNIGAMKVSVVTTFPEAGMIAPQQPCRSGASRK